MKGLKATNTFLDERIIVENDKEIPIMIQVYTTKQNIEMHNFDEPEKFGNDYEAVYAFTMKFSK